MGVHTFAVCSMVTTTLVCGLDTRSIAPPIPFTTLPYTQDTHTHTHAHVNKTHTAPTLHAHACKDTYTDTPTTQTHPLH